MNIVFDIDDTIVDETGFMIKHAPNYLKKKHGLSAEVVNPTGYNVAEVFGLEKIFIEQGLKKEDAEQKCKAIINGFWNTHFLKYVFQPLKKGAKETINKLYEDGYNIYYVSLRGKKTKKESTYMSEFIRLKIVPFLTKLQLKLNGVKYDQIKLVGDTEEKLEFIKTLKPDYVFEDQPNIINQIEDPIRTICVNCDHNISSDIPTSAVRINGYENSEAYNLIKSDKKTSKREILCNKEENKIPKLINFKFYKKILTEATYTIVRHVAKDAFIKKYQPIICGVDNIPNDKRPVVFVGNHRHKLDPVMMTIAIEKPTHWAALLRMFQGKENLFNLSKNPIQCYLSAAFITAMGAVPIARPSDDNHNEINKKSIVELTQYLNWGGAVGIYPEGTINRSPEEQNLHPLKSIRAFRLATYNQTWVQPITIVWVPKNAGIPNRTILLFSNPIDTSNMKTKELSDAWAEITNSNIDKINLLISYLEEVNSKKYDEEIKQEEKERVLKLFINNQFPDHL